MVVTVAEDAKSLRDYCHQMIDENPQWVSYLSSAFKKGRFQAFVKVMQEQEQEDDEPNLGMRISGKVRKLAKLPTKTKFLVLQALRPFLGDLVFKDVESDAVDAHFNYILHINDDCPYPEDEMAYHFDVLVGFCKKRDIDVNKRLAKEGEIVLTNKAVEFSFYEVHDQQLEIDETMQIEFLPTSEKKDLPKAAGGTSWKWTLKDAKDFNTTLSCTEAPMMLLTASAFFKLPSMGEAWDYHWDDVKKEFPPASTSSSSSSGHEGAEAKKRAVVSPAKRLSLLVSPPAKTSKKK
jgi:hypothetical protein